MPAIFLVAAGVGAWATYDWLRTPVNATQVEGEIEAKTSEIAALSEELGFSMPPIGSFDAILKRPIFAPNRRAVAGPTAAIVNEQLGLELLGIVGDGANIRILLKPTDGGEVVSLRVGEEFRGWAFTGVEDGNAIFDNGGGEVETLGLNYEKAPQPTAKSRRDKRRNRAQQAQKQKQRKQTGTAEVVAEEAEEDEPAQPSQ